MAQADGVVANGTGSAVRSDINNQYAALWSNHSGSTEPSSGKVAYQFWADTNTNILKIRNSANNAWISLFTLAGGIDVDAASNFNEDVTFTGASYNLVWDKSDNALEFADSAKLKFGAGDDLQIYHNGSHSFLINNTGDFVFQGDSIDFWNNAGTEEHMKLQAEAGVELYFDDSKKFETESTGVKVTGNAEVTGNIELPTVNTWIKGNGSNSVLQVDATKTYFYGGSGGIQVRKADNSTHIITVDDNGNTTVAGNIDIPNDSGKLRLGTSQDLEIYHDGNNSFIKDAGTGRLSIVTSQIQLTNSIDSEVMIKATENDAVELYYDGTKTFETTSSGAKVSGFLSCERAETALTVHQTSTDDVVGAIFRHNRGGLSGFTGKMISFRGNDSTEEGSIVIGTTATAYNTSSDYRLKENEVAISDGITRLKTLKPYRFNFKKDKDTTVDGFFAHEVTPVVPEAIYGTKDATNSDGSINPQQIDQSKLVPLLTAALQEAITKIETLETKVAALEAK